LVVPEGSVMQIQREEENKCCMIHQKGGYIMCDWVLKMNCQPLQPSLTLFASGLRCAKFIQPHSSPPSTFISQ
jgi:hypothetical protein